MGMRILGGLAWPQGFVGRLDALLESKRGTLVTGEAAAPVVDAISALVDEFREAGTLGKWVFVERVRTREGQVALIMDTVDRGSLVIALGW